jgi:hypothetical protein
MFGGEFDDQLARPLANGWTRTRAAMTALLCSAAAEAGHSELLHTLQRFPEIDRRDASRPKSPSMRLV